MTTPKKTKLPDFEKSLAELENIVDRMERGEQTLDQSMKDFERGMLLSEQCQKSLDAAQQKVEKLVRKHGSYQLEDLDEEDEDLEFEDDN